MDAELAQMMEDDHLREAKLVHRVFVWFGLLYVSFTLIDFIYAPTHVGHFVIFRLAYLSVPAVNYVLASRVGKFRTTEWMAFLNGAVAANIITYMIFATEGPKSPYYAGINLVGIIALSFFTFSRFFFWLTALIIYSPYIVASVISNRSFLDPAFLMNSSFMLGTILTSALIHHFKEYFRAETLKSRLDLRRELEDRDRVIKRKTDESIQLSALSAQFSPQIVDSIRSGKISLDSGSARENICTIFIDIVNSTQRVVRIDKSDVEVVMTQFLEDSMRILLKYDITIDKFLGDGILAFANAPARRQDYVERVLRAALEIRDRISQNREVYQKHWGASLEIRIGVARGEANVGFFGARRHFRSFTAIGPVVNLASRLCASAAPNQILIDQALSQEAERDFEIAFVGTKTLKGFDDSGVRVFEINALRSQDAAVSALMDCPNCHSVLSVEMNAQNQYELVCRNCRTTLDNSDFKRNVA